MAEHNDLGKQGEEIASSYISSKGYKILERNWVYNHRELDIIAEKDGFLVIIEVKTRYKKYFDGISSLISNRKIQNILDATEAYIAKRNIDKEVRFDVVVVIINNNEKIVELVEGAFSPTMN